MQIGKTHEKELSILLQAIEEAGDAILTLQQKDFLISKKNNHEMVTQADLIANDILKTQLLDAFPDVGWLSEESVDDASRLRCQRVWIVDPIDGTKEFAEKMREFAISVALVDEGVPVVSAVFNPATAELFYAVKGEGAWLNRQRIFCKREKTSTNFLLLASRSEYQRGEWRRFETDHQVKPVGSIAYKLALIASGTADATFSLGPKHEWDIAAGTLLIREAEGIVTNRCGKEFVFNHNDVKVDGILAAANASCYEEIVALIAKHPLN